MAKPSGIRTRATINCIVRKTRAAVERREQAKRHRMAASMPSPYCSKCDELHDGPGTTCARCRTEPLTPLVSDDPPLSDYLQAVLA